MTETEYKLLSSLASVLDTVRDCMDSIEEISGEIIELEEKVGDIFYEIRDENFEEWDGMQRAEAKVVEKTWKDKSKKRREHEINR